MMDTTHSDLKQTSQQMLAALSLVGQVAMHQSAAQPAATTPQTEAPNPTDPWLNLVSLEEYREVIQKLVGYVHLPAGHLQRTDEMYLEQQLSDMLGFSIAAELEGKRLNHSIGIMGAEQHLKRSPTDTLAAHDAFPEAGLAANRGAFGWFTENGQLTPEAIQREKYYFAVQLQYLPDWNTAHAQLKPWYKYRKMIMINPAEELAVVGVIADAGPALWVQKQFGGSPEVIREGKVWSPKSQGHVLLYFIDDPEDTIPLGTIDLRTLVDQSADVVVSDLPTLVPKPGPTP